MNAKNITRCVRLLLALAVLLSFLLMQAFAYYENGYALSEDVRMSPSASVEQLELSDEAGLAVDADPKTFMYENIIPLSTAVVDSWSALRDAVNNPAVTEIILENDITLPTGAAGNAIVVPLGRDVLLTSAPGQAYTLTRVAGGQRHFWVDGTLRLENVELNGNYPAITANHGGVEVRAGGNLHMEDGSAIRYNRNTSGSQGGGVTVSGAGATFTMSGGEISGNSAFTATVNNGVVGGVFVQNGAVFTMNGGAIYDNAGRLGGGVTINSAAVFAVVDTRFIMNGGEIRNNTSTLGGGVNLERGTFTMTDGTIHSNAATGLGNPPSTTVQANRGGAGVFVQNAGRFYMEGGAIRDNSSGNHGGGVMLLAGTGLTMESGAIRGNTAVSNGGGVHITNAPFTMTGGAIVDNTAATNGGGIWLGTGNSTANARLNMTGGELSGNTAINGDGGGIFTSAYVYADPLPLTAYANILAAQGVFSGNTAGGGRFAPPLNAAAFSFGYLLNNDDINYRGTIRLHPVTFKPGAHGTLDHNTVDITILVGVGTTLTEVDIPQANAKAGWTFAGWSPLIPLGYEVNAPITFTAQWRQAQPRPDPRGYRLAPNLTTSAELTPPEIPGVNANPSTGRAAQPQVIAQYRQGRLSLPTGSAFSTRR